MTPLSSVTNSYTHKKAIYKLAEFGKLSSGLFHDMMHPITWLLLEIDNLAHDKQHKSLIESRRVLQQYISNMRKLLSAENNTSTFHIKKEIDSSLHVLRYKLQHKNISVKTHIPSKLKYTGNPFTFYQVITNLISNAIDAYENSKNKQRKIIITVTQQKNNLLISIEDFGCGISLTQQKRIFHPFVSSKKGPNLGLGLSICKDIIEKEYKGKIVVKSELTKGTIFTLILPLN